MRKHFEHILDLITYDDLDEDQKLERVKEYINTELNAQRILIIDIETTGFLQAKGKIVEIGIVELDLSTGNTKILFDEVCHETGITMEEVKSSWIIENSDLTIEEVRNSRNLSLMHKEIQDIINSYELGATAFNNAFDFGFLEDRGFKFPKKLGCPMKLSVMVCKIPNKNGRGFKWPKVEQAYDYFVGENDYKEKHRGADDAVHEAVIVKYLFDLGIFKLE